MTRWEEQMASYPTEILIRKIACFSGIVSQYNNLLKKGIPDCVSRIELETHSLEMIEKIHFLSGIVIARRDK